MGENKEIKGPLNLSPVALTRIGEYSSTRPRIIATISLLEYLGGKDNVYNPYNDAITRLEGVLNGMDICERANDM